MTTGSIRQWYMTELVTKLIFGKEQLI